MSNNESQYQAQKCETCGKPKCDGEVTTYCDGMLFSCSICDSRFASGLAAIHRCHGNCTTAPPADVVGQNGPCHERGTQPNATELRRWDYSLVYDSEMYTAAEGGVWYLASDVDALLQRHAEEIAAKDEEILRLCDESDRLKRERDLARWSCGIVGEVASENTGELQELQVQIAKLEQVAAENYDTLIREMRHAWNPRPSTFVRFEEIEAFIRSMGAHKVANSIRAEYETELRRVNAVIAADKDGWRDLYRNELEIRSAEITKLADNLAAQIEQHAAEVAALRAECATKDARIAELSSKLRGVLAERSVARSEAAALARVTQERDELRKFVQNVVLIDGYTSAAEAFAVYEKNVADCAANEKKRVEIAALRPLAEIGRLAVDLREADAPLHVFAQKLIDATNEIRRTEEPK